MVSALTDQNYFLIAVVIFRTSTIYSIFLLRQGFRQDNRINYLLLLGAFIFHSLAMFKRGFSLQRCPMNNLYEATLVIAWTIVAAYLVFGAWSRLRFLGARSEERRVGKDCRSRWTDSDEPPASSGTAS